MFSLMLRLSSLHLLLLILVMSAVPGFAHSAVDPTPREEQEWNARHQLLNQRATEAGKNAQVIFIGDSITEAWEKEGKEVWAKYYAARGAVNLGIGGDRTQNILWRLDHGNLEGLRPKLAVLMIGTNNLYWGNSVEQIAEGVTAVVQKLRQKLPDTRVLLVAIFPRGENPNPVRGDALQVNQIIQTLADGEHVFWADFGYRFVDKHGLISAKLMPDYLHLSAKGYQVWAEAIEKVVSSTLGDPRLR